MKAIESQEMGPYYRHVCKELKWPEDKNLSERLAEKNEKTLKELVRAIFILKFLNQTSIFTDETINTLSQSSYVQSPQLDEPKSSL